MNFEYFQTLVSNAAFDEIKVIGKDLEKDDQPYHIMGMTLKDKKAVLYVLEAPSYLICEEEYRECKEAVCEKTHRDSLKENMVSDRNQSFFMHIREFQNEDITWEAAGAQSGAISAADYGEAYVLFMKMSMAGWKVSEDSPFYDMDWNRFAITNIELRGEFESLPEWGEEIQVSYDIMPEQYPIEKPVLLECGKTTDIEFSLEDGRPAVCHINKIELIDIWEGQEKRFEEPEYKKRLLEHMSESEFEEMKQNFFHILEEHCPKGKCFLGIEYECSEESIGLNFYDKEYLDSVPQPSSGSCSAMMMRHKPEQEIGSHGLKLKGEIIQKPLDKGTETLEAELFGYYTKIEQKKCRLADLLYTPVPEVVIGEEEKAELVSCYNLIKPVVTAD